jgi:hypothetical protein
MSVLFMLIICHTKYTSSGGGGRWNQLSAVYVLMILTRRDSCVSLFTLNYLILDVVSVKSIFKNIFKLDPPLWEGPCLVVR